jgi:hypothetical protein
VLSETVWAGPGVHEPPLPELYTHCTVIPDGGLTTRGFTTVAVSVSDTVVGPDAPATVKAALPLVGLQPVVAR